MTVQVLNIERGTGLLAITVDGVPYRWSGLEGGAIIALVDHIARAALNERVGDDFIERVAFGVRRSATIGRNPISALEAVPAPSSDAT